MKVNFTTPSGQLINYFLYADADVGVKPTALINSTDGRRWHEAEARSFQLISREIYSSIGDNSNDSWKVEQTQFELRCW